jgi:hypothetical protein
MIRGLAEGGGSGAAAPAAESTLQQIGLQNEYFK